MRENDRAEEYTRDKPLVMGIDGATKLEVFTESGVIK